MKMETETFGYSTMGNNESYYIEPMYDQDLHMLDNKSFEEYQKQKMREFEEYIALVNSRPMYRSLYFAFAAAIVLFNVLWIVAICISRKQRRHFRNWLLLHVAIIHILIGGITCPFLGQQCVSLSAGLNTVICKLLYFLSDTLDYTSNVSVAIFGVYQCITMLSPRVLKGVSHALLTSMMIIIPWFVCVTLTVVLRLTMTEEQYGQCYLISDRTAQTLWLVLATILPLLIVFLSFIIVIAVACSPFISAVDSSPPGRRYMTFFTSAFLLTYMLMRPPFQFLFSRPLEDYCHVYNSRSWCKKLVYTLDQVRLANIVLVPLIYLIPVEIKIYCKRFRSKVLCKSVESNTTPKKQSLEMVTVKTQERTVV